MRAPKVCTAAFALLCASCGEPSLVTEDASVEVTVVEPASGSQLPLSASIEVVVAAAASSGRVTAIELHVAVADCQVGESCERLTLRRNADQFVDGRARFCLATHLAPVDRCPDEPQRLSVAGLRNGQPLRLWATAAASAERSHHGRSEERSLTLVDDLAPVVTLGGGISFEDDSYGPGDRIAIAIQVVDDQSGIGSVVLHKRGLDGLADADEAWLVDAGMTALSGTTTIAVPRDYLCPGTFSIEVDVADAASPPNAATVTLGPGCVGVCSDRTPPGFENVQLSFVGENRTPPFATAGERLTLSFRLDDDLFLDRLPLVELVQGGQVISSAVNPSVQDQTPGAGYVYTYQVDGHEPPGDYLLRISAQDPHCNTGQVELPLILDFTDSPSNLHVFNDARTADSIALAWDLPIAVTPPRLHLFHQSYQTVPFEDDYAEVPLPSNMSPFMHDGLTPATQYAYRLVAESAVTSGLFTDAAELRPVCTRPALPWLEVGKHAQSWVEVAVGLGRNPSGTPLHLTRCPGTLCGTGDTCQASANNCQDLGLRAPGTLQVDGLAPDSCYALVLTARGCGADTTPTTVCALTLPKPAFPSWINVASRTSDAITFRWQRVVAGDEDPVRNYELMIGAGGLVVTVPQTDLGIEPTYQVRGLAPGQAVAVSVRAQRASDSVGDYSPFFTAHALAVAPPPLSGVARSHDEIALTLDTGVNADECATRYSIVDTSTAMYVGTDGVELATPVFAPIGDLCPAPYFSTTLVVIGLLPDSDHVFEIVARNGDDIDTSRVRSATIVTLASVMPVPLVRSDGLGGLFVFIAQNVNPARTRYAIAIGADRYATLAGQLATTAFFATLQEWDATVGGAHIVGTTPDTLTEVAIYAQNAAGLPSSAPSASAEAWTAPVPPLQLTARGISPSTVQISWARGSNPATTRFEIARNEPPLAVRSPGTSIDDSNLGADTRYTYSVRAVGGESSPQFSTWVGPVSAITWPAPPAPPLVTPLDDEHQLGLVPGTGDANPASTLVAFMLDGRYVRSDGTLGNSTPDAQTFVAKSALAAVTVGSLNPASLHSAKVVAKGLDQSLVESATVDQYTRPARPGDITFGSNTQTTQLQLSWGANGNPSGTFYDVERAPDGTSFGAVARTTETYLIDGGLTPGGSYTYRVSAEAHGLRSVATPGALDTTWPAAPPAPALSVPASGVHTDLLVALASDTNHASVEYAVRVRVGATNSWLSATGALVGGEVWQLRSAWSNAWITGLAANTQYPVAVLARNSAHDPPQEGATALRYTAAVVPGAPAVVASRARNDVLTITLTPAAPANPPTTPVAIRVNCGSALYLQATGTLGPSALFRVPADWGSVISAIGLSPNTRCSIDVAARNPDGVVTPFSAPAATWTAPAAPTAVAIVPRQVSAQLTWGASAASSYRLMRSADCNSYAPLGDTAALTYNDLALSPSTSYCYRVYGLNPDLVESPQYAQSNTSTLTPTPLKPTDPIVKSGAGAANPVPPNTSDSPVQSLVPTFSATHHDEATPTDAVQVLLEVQDSGSNVIRTATSALVPVVANSGRTPDLAMPYIIEPLDFTAGTGFAAIGGNRLGRIFALEGNGTPHFHALNPRHNIWTTLADATVAPGAGAAMAYDPAGRKIYVLAGGGSSVMISYDPTSDRWGALAPPLSPIGCGTIGANAAIAVGTVSTTLAHYVYSGSGDRIWVWDSSAWRCNEIRLPFTPGAGFGLAVMGTVLFAIQGANATVFEACSLLTGGPVASCSSGWTPLPTVPTAVGQGGGLIAETVNGTRLYITTGGNRASVYRYAFGAGAPASGTHTLLGQLPGASMAFGGNRLVYFDLDTRLYALAGDSDSVWFYDPAALVFSGTPRSSAGDIAQPLASGQSYRFRITYADANGWGSAGDWVSFSVTVP